MHGGLYMKKSRKKKRIAQIFVMLLSLAALTAAAVMTYIEMQPMVANAVTIEAGTPSVDVADFILNDDDAKGSFVTDISSLSLSTPGVYEVQIKINRRVFTSNLEVVDTIPPKAEPAEVIALLDEEVNALDFVSNVIDATDVKASFVTEPDTAVPGEKQVKVALEDAGGNITIIESKLTVLEVKSTVYVEAGTEPDIKPEDFVDNNSIKVTILSDISALDTSVPAVHPVQIEVEGRILNSNIEVVDTTPPTATPVNNEVWQGDTLQAIDFVKDVIDVSLYKATYAAEPDFNTPGDQEVTVIVEDYYGNKTEVKATLTVKLDTEPPVFSGITDKIVYEGDSVSYKKGVTVTDNRDTNISFTVDSSKVNLNKPGTYKVYYTAVDSSENKATESATITVKELVITDEMLWTKVDPILEKITKKSMTKREVAYAIYKWVKSNVSYTGTSDKTDWRKEAYKGIVNGVGDCFTYYAVSEALLTRAGIDNMRVTRVGGKTQHFWNLINCGDGWYHFDACPNKDKMETFMLTDAEVEAYTKKRGNNYYNFDKSLYPRTPEK